MVNLFFLNKNKRKTVIDKAEIIQVPLTRDNNIHAEILLQIAL